MDKAVLARIEKQAWFHRYPRGWPLLLFFLVALGTILSVVATERVDAERRQVELDRNVTEVVSGLQRRASENIAILRAAAALFATNNRVTPRQFSEIADGLYSGGDRHGALGIGWARWLRADDVPGFEAGMHALGVSGYRVHPRPASGRDVVVAVTYLDPVTPGNRLALGFDAYSEETRRAAMDLAASTTEPAASGRVHLAQDWHDPNGAGFLIYMPVFAGTGAQRHILGFVYAPLRGSDFLASAIELMRNRRVDISVYDGLPESGRLLMAKLSPGENTASMDRRIVVANRPWVVRVSPKRTTALSPLSRATLVFGTVLGVLVMVIARLITKRAAEDRAVLEWLTGQSAIRTSLTRELNHRVKNTLANVLSIVALTRRRSTSLDDFAESLTGRIRALSATHDLLSHSDWNNASILDIVHSELAPYLAADDSQIEMAGPDISLAPNDALSLGLAIHELATNAAKYGALSTAEGRIAITWRPISPEVAELNWRETGGPQVVAPEKRGFGRDLLEKIVAHELQSKVELQFHAEGVECTLQVPVRELKNFALRSIRRSGE
jgi:two-component sensor histidine kinase